MLGTVAELPDAEHNPWSMPRALSWICVLPPYKTPSAQSWSKKPYLTPLNALPRCSWQHSLLWWKEGKKKKKMKKKKKKKEAGKKRKEKQKKKNKRKKKERVKRMVHRRCWQKHRFCIRPSSLLPFGSEQGSIFSPSALNLTLLLGLWGWNIQVPAIKIISRTQHTHLALVTRKGGCNFNAINLISGIPFLISLRNPELHFISIIHRNRYRNLPKEGALPKCSETDHPSWRRVHCSCHLHPAQSLWGFATGGVDKNPTARHHHD